MKIDSSQVSGDRAPRVAILDTSLDKDHPGIMGCSQNFCGLRSFTDGDTRDYHGHGTFIASLVLKVAPQSNLYIAKVAERRLLPLKNKVAEVRIFETTQVVAKYLVGYPVGCRSKG
jgi:hypothetical protein